MIKQFSKADLQRIRLNVNALLKDYAAKEGITLELGNISFTETTFTGKLEAKIKNAEDPILARKMAQYNLGKVGTNGRVLVAYNTRAHTMPFVYEMGGKRFKCSPEIAKAYFGI